MKFIVFVIDSQSESASGDEIAEIDKFNAELKANQNWIFAAGIAAPERALLIDARPASPVIETGSLFNLSDYYSGFWLIEAPDLESAVQIASKGSKACNRKVELRPFLG